jgi:hypothetical protein
LLVTPFFQSLARKTGTRGIGDMPGGTDICVFSQRCAWVFYESKGGVLDANVVDLSAGQSAVARRNVASAATRGEIEGIVFEAEHCFRFARTLGLAKKIA